MNDEEVLEKLISLEIGDTEQTHYEADNILSDFVRSLGYDKIADAYDKVDKWYA